jgi:hypothetical protein
MSQLNFLQVAKSREIFVKTLRSMATRTSLVFLPLLLSYLVSGYSMPTMNTLSGKSWNHGDPNMVCTHATTNSIALLLFANYVAHAATVKSYPAFSTLLALVFPSSRIIRVMNALVHMKGTELQKAARAGALCMVVRSPDWQPQDGDTIHDISLAFPEKVREQYLGPAKEDPFLLSHSNDDMELQEHTPGVK